MNDLAILTSSALLGTDRSPLGQLENHHLETTRTQLAGDATAQLLSVAALAFNMARAGQSAAGTQPLPEPAPRETKPTLPNTAQARWMQLLANDNGLILEWLELVVQKGYVMPHNQLISLLDYGRQNTHQRAVMQSLLGTRGRWLAQQNSYWAWAMGDTSSEENTLETWETGGKAARVLALNSIRATNPEQARTLLQAVWKSEPADERKTFLALFETGLSDADEPFLESCLDDRSKDVRAIAAELLAKLPNSAFVARMKTRAAKLLLIGKKELEVVLPEWEDGFLRDGLEKKSPFYNVGEKAYWWRTIVARASGMFWQEQLKLTPAEIIKRLPKEWKENFITALLELPINLEWAEALITYNRQYFDNFRVATTLSSERREDLIRKHFFGQGFLQAPVLSDEWFRVHPTMWSVGFCADALKWILFVGEKVIAGSKNYFHLSNMATHLPIEVAQDWLQNSKIAQLLAQLEQAKSSKKEYSHIDYFSDQLKTLLSTSETRLQMRKELQP